MVDLVELLGRVAGWVYWLAWASALGSAGASMLYMALGDRDRAVTLFKGSIASILVAVFGQTILSAVIGVLGGWEGWSAQAGQVTGYPEAGTAIYIMAFIMLLLAAVNLARGHVAEGGWMIVGSVLALAVVVFAAQTFNTTVIQYGGGPLLVEARTDKTMYEPGQEVLLYVMVRTSGLAVNTASLAIDWGDGTTATVQGVPVGREVKICYNTIDDKWIYVNPDEKPFYCQGKTYGLRSGEEASFYTIKITATATVGDNRLEGSTYVTVYVRELPKLSFPFSVLGGFISWLVNMLTGGTLDPTRLFYAPVFRMDGPEGGWYRVVLTTAVALLPIFLLFRIAPGLAYDPGAAIVGGFRDAALAVIAMMLVPYAYNVTAGALNSFTESLMGPAGSAIVSQMAGTAIAWGVVFMVVSLVSPGVGFLGATMFMTVFLVSALITLRWFILLAFVSASPLLVLAWLHPYLRGAVESVKGLVGAMLIAGPLAAAFTTMFAKVMLGDNPLQQLAGSFALSWLGVFVVGLLPQVISGLAVTGLGSTISHRLEMTAMRGAPQVGRAITTGMARGAATGAHIAGRATYAAAVRVRPIADVMRSTGRMVGRARETTSRAIAGVKERFEGMVARARENHERAVAELQTLRNLRTMIENYANAPSEEARWSIEMSLGALKRGGVISDEAYEKLVEGLSNPKQAIKSMDRMIEDAEYKVQVRKADLGFMEAAPGRFARALEAITTTIPVRVRQIINTILSQQGLTREKKKEKREKHKGVVEGGRAQRAGRVPGEAAAS